MEDPRLRILKMVEEGKISAEEAARLLESLEHAPRPQHEHPHGHGPHHPEHQESGGRWGMGFQGVMRGIGSMVSEIMRVIPDALESSVRNPWANVKQNIPVEGIKHIRIKHMGGDLRVQVRPTSEIAVSGTGSARVVKRVGDDLNVKVMGGDSSLTIPPGKPLELKAMGGDVEILNLQQESQVKILGGDVSLDVQELRDIRGKIAGGDLTLRIPKDASFEVEVHFRHGDRHTPWTETEEDPLATGDLVFAPSFQERLQKISDHHYQIGDAPKAKIQIEISGGTVRFEER